MKFYNEYFDIENDDIGVYLESEKEAMLPENQISRLAYGFSLVKKAIAEKLIGLPESTDILITGFDKLVMANTDMFNIAWSHEKGKETDFNGIKFTIDDFTLDKTDEYVFKFTRLGE